MVRALALPDHHAVEQVDKAKLAQLFYLHCQQIISRRWGTLKPPLAPMKSGHSPTVELRGEVMYKRGTGLGVRPQVGAADDVQVPMALALHRVMPNVGQQPEAVGGILAPQLYRHFA